MAAQSLHRQTIVRVIPASLLLLLLVALVTWWQVSTVVRSEVQARLDAAAFNKSNIIDAKLKLVVAACRAAAQNEVLVNGIIDEEYRDSVTRPFLRSYRLPGAGEQRIAVTDHRGRLLAGEIDAVGGAGYVAAVMNGRTVIDVLPTAITIAAPVLYNSSPEAIVVARFDAGDFFKDLATEQPRTFTVLEFGDHVLAASSVDAADRLKNRPEEHILATSASANVRDLHISVLEPNSYALRTVGVVRQALLSVACIVLLGFLAAIWFTSVQVSNPLSKMISQIRYVQDTNDLSLRLEEAGPLEIVELNHRLNSMLKSLEQSTVSLERYQRSQQQLELALAGGNIGLWDWDVATGEVYYSPIMKTQLGFAPDDAWNSFEDWKSRLHPDDLPRAMETVNDYLEQRADDYKSTFRMLCVDGTYRWVFAKGVAQFDHANMPIRMVGVHVDIHERIENEEALKNLNRLLSENAMAIRESNRMLMSSNSELEQFAYVASHDLQEPLRKMSSFCNLLDEECGDTLQGDARLYMNYIVDGASRMQQLIRDLLAFSRVKSQECEGKMVDAEAACRSALQNLEEAIEESGARITIAQLPTVWAHERHLAQVFQNLISNSIKYRSEEVVEINIDAERQGHEWVISVRDNGIGIESEFHERVFGVFKRLHGRNVYPGTGIGLAICKRAVERWGGRIWIAIGDGDGCTFSFALPSQDPTKNDNSSTPTVAKIGDL